MFLVAGGAWGESYAVAGGSLRGLGAAVAGGAGGRSGSGWGEPPVGTRVRWLGSLGTHMWLGASVGTRVLWLGEPGGLA